MAFAYRNRVILIQSFIGRVKRKRIDNEFGKKKMKKINFHFYIDTIVYMFCLCIYVIALYAENLWTDFLFHVIQLGTLSLLVFFIFFISICIVIYEAKQMADILLIPCINSMLPYIHTPKNLNRKCDVYKRETTTSTNILMR